jgi:hypothetical protein
VGVKEVRWDGGGTESIGKYTFSRWVDNIKMALREIGWSGMNWIDLA